MPRFVVLYHELPAGVARPSHWDFMLEADDVLFTWALAQPPDSPGLIPADRIADHAKKWLEYEGLVSGGRGRATRWDRGTFEWITEGETSLTVRLDGDRLAGAVALRQTDSGGWQWEAAAPLGL